MVNSYSELQIPYALAHEICVLGPKVGGFGVDDEMISSVDFLVDCICGIGNPSI